MVMVKTKCVLIVLEEVFYSLGEPRKKEEEIKQNKKVNNLKDKNVHKLVLLYFLKHVLFGNEGKNIINMQWVGLIDGSKVFNKYP